ncbi:MAG: SdpI family protein [Thiomonas arsenitoxydans]|uniref:SdpI family protein n=1 Tax=Thiomonas arsenitoxydans (strain DSM 22701 / CIP 110005 / 3As) TaxID=426114 RepID=A0A8I1MY25_THIA3|nr:SdpI family protein [Thiomonas arsenitoxydans]MBN8745062.1 SdpI family protein [Thiomonas arsenitoxydans]
MKKTYVFLAIASLLLIAISIPLIFQKIPPNEYYGVRTHATLSNADNWYKTNKIYGECTVLSGLVFFVVSFVVGGWRNGTPDFLNYGLLAIQVFIPTIISLLYSNHCLR